MPSEPPTIAELWNSLDAEVWNKALKRYWDFIKPANLELERRLESLNRERIRSLDEQAWYDFLHDDYFRWKYTAANRYATTTRHLHRYIKEGRLDDLFSIKQRLLSLIPSNIRRGLLLASEIHGLGTAGASGLLALLYPENFGTVDQFAVKALCDVPDLADAEKIKKMNPEGLTCADGELLIHIMQQKAAENNKRCDSTFWTPRKVDKVLWTYGRSPD